MLQKIRRKLIDLVTWLQYKTEQILYHRHLPVLDKTGYEVLRSMRKDGIVTIPLQDLELLANDSFLKVTQQLIQDLLLMNAEDYKNEYGQGFQHCIPINPTTIACKYPELYLWGLDEKLLDIIENCMGLPVAYHGVVARKEIIDGQQIGTRVWHKDSEDRNIIRVIIYLTDVLDRESGPFEYIPRTMHLLYKDFKRIDIIDDAAMSQVIPEKQWQTCLGPANTVIFSSVAKVFHRGRIPQKERIAISFCYTSRNPLNPALCKAYSFQKGLPLLNVQLSERQKACLWDYQSLLPAYREKNLV